MLPKEIFETVVESAPLVSIDLIIRNSSGELLLGRRLNRPAKGFWFVPGGRILKNESISAAFKRISGNELGKLFFISDARYIGLFEHFYEDSVFGDSTSTHYVVNGFELIIEEDLHLPTVQHVEYVWMSERELLASDFVHPHCKWYFQPNKGFRL